MIDDTWHNMLWTYPPDALIQLIRKDWDGPIVCYINEVPAEANCSGLFWKLTGIGREKLGWPEDRNATMQHMNEYRHLSGMLAALLGPSAPLGSGLRG